MKRIITILIFSLTAFVSQGQRSTWWQLNQSSGASANAFVTKWSIPSNSYTLSIPFASSSNNFTIYWGDGSSDLITTNITKTHTYATTGTYTISIDGTCPSINFTSKSELQEITQWGNTGCTSFTCISSGLTTISAATSSVFFNGCSSLSSCFNSTKLTSIPSGLFNSAINAASMSGIFYGCTSMTAAIPANLFDSAKKATSFYACFQNTKIASIPSNLFDYNTLVISFEACFQNTPITSIPSGLFTYNTAVTTFLNTFSSSKITSIPSVLFGNSAALFSSTFQNCTSLTSIPSTLFSAVSSAKSFISTFQGCTGLTSIPSGLFNS